MKTHCMVTVSLLMMSVCATAQDQTSPMYRTSGEYSAQIMGVQYDSAGVLITAAPYSAEAITDSVQMLSDGNRIRNRNSAMLYRDGQGRTRREQTVIAIGPWRVSGSEGRMVFIHDPVTQQSYLLDEENRTARPLAASNHGTVTYTKGGDYVKGGSYASAEDGPTGDIVLAPAPGFMPADAADTVQTGENLGQRQVEGVLAFGSKTKFVIEANAIGNEQAIEVSTERWFSPAIRAVVMSKYSDPRFGEITYRLINISQEEPDPILFKVPDNYRVIDGRH